MSTFDRLHNDVLVEVLAHVDVESVLQVGAACRRLRTATLLDRVWTPRLATAGLGRSTLDATALAELAALGNCPRRLFLQCMPWRPRCGADPSAKAGRLQSTFSWRPLPMPPSLRQSDSGGFFFVELCESEDCERAEEMSNLSQLTRVSVPYPGWKDKEPHYYKQCFGHKFVALDRCIVEASRGPLCEWLRVTVPLNIDTSALTARDKCYLEVRVFMQLEGTLLPVADSCCMNGTDFGRRHGSRMMDSSGELGHTLKLDLRLQMTNETWTVEADGKTAPAHLASLFLDWNCNTREQVMGTYLDLSDGMRGLVDLHNSHAMRVASTLCPEQGFSYIFACDYDRDSAGQVDFSLNKRQARELSDAERNVLQCESEVERLEAKLAFAKDELALAKGKRDFLVS